MSGGNNCRQIVTVIELGRGGENRAGAHIKRLQKMEKRDQRKLQSNACRK